LCCSNLIGTIDPFVALFAVGKDTEIQIGRTGARNGNLNPEWNESFLCTIPRDVTVLRARVMGGESTSSSVQPQQSQDSRTHSCCCCALKTGSSKHIATLDFDLTSNNQTMDSTIGWFPLDSERGELRIGWRTYPLTDLLALPNQLNELRASHTAEVRRLEVSVAEAEGRAQAAEKRAQVRCCTRDFRLRSSQDSRRRFGQALQAESSSGSSALEAIAADHSKAQEQNSSLIQQLAHKDAEIAQLRQELEEQKQVS
jgi:hypothetical protein